MNLTSQVLANDLRKKRTGEGEATYIGKKDSKGFEHVLAIFKEFDKIKALSQHFKSAEPLKQSKKIDMKPGGNIYEHVLSEVKNGRPKV